MTQFLIPGPHGEALTLRFVIRLKPYPGDDLFEPKWVK